MEELLNKFENKAPEIVFEWSDQETEAKGWVVINSLRGGAAGGGTRMRPGLDRREVESLAKTMEIKFTISGPAIGGAKSGINFDPSDPRKSGVLRRWYKAVIPLLKNYYGTGGDLNVDEIHEVIPITEMYGLWHPQEGVVEGHFSPTESQKIKAIGQLRQGVSKVLEDARYTPDVSRKFTVADMITGYGVAESVRHYYALWGGTLEGKRAIIQGWGNVGATAAYFLSGYGVKITGIIDKSGGLITAEGIDSQTCKSLLLNRKNNQLSGSGLCTFEEARSKVWDVGAEIFIPAAASRLVTLDQVQRMHHHGLQVISCGANVPFADPEIFFGPIAAKTDSITALIPDFIANCGMARVFAYLMQPDAEITDEAIFSDTSRTILHALKKVHDLHPSSQGVARAALGQALQQLI